MNTIDEEYVKTNKAFDQSLGQINIDVANSKFPTTYKCLIRGAAKIDLILGSIINSEKIFYVSQILTRTLFEHYLVAHYLWTKMRVEKNDNAGTEYMREYFCSEYFKQDNYNYGVDNIKDNKNDKLNIETIRLKYPEFKEMEQTDLDNIHKISGQFDIRKIGNYLVNHVPSEDEFNTIHLSMLDFLKRYNHLSSYVHGGPYAEMQTFDNDENVDKPKTCLENINWGKICSKQIKRGIILTLVSEFPSTYIPIWKSFVE